MKYIQKYITVFVVLSLLFLIIPSTTSKGITKENSIIEKNQNAGKITGLISVYTSSWKIPEPLSGMKITVDGRHDYSDELGQFEINNLALNKNYEVVFSYGLKTVRTKDVYLSTDDPDCYLPEDFAIRDLSKTKEKTTAGIGEIYGHTGTSHIWGFTPVPFATVTAGFKCTISAYPLGYYSIKGLPLNQKITITATKRGHTEFTTTVVLTENNPSKQVFLDIERDGEGIKSKNIQREMRIDLFSLISLCSNARSNLFSTASFVS